MKRPEFIFMLTRADRTVPDAMDRLAEVLASGVRHIGFKDVGLPLSELRGLAETIRKAGALVYLEVVSLDAASEAASAGTAAELGVDYLLGGTSPGVVLPVIAGTGIRYFPFAGRITGHPSVLEGTIEEIVDSARRLADLDGVHGLDLLAYRFKADVPALMRTLCAAVGKPVIVAGSIDHPDRVGAAISAGAAAITVGTAALDGIFPARSIRLADQIEAIQAAVSATLSGKVAGYQDGITTVATQVAPDYETRCFRYTPDLAATMRVPPMDDL